MKKIILFFSIGTLAAALYACDKKVGKLPQSAPATVNACDTITYQKHIKPIFDNNCLYCHTATANQGPDMSTYDLLKSKALGGSLKARVIDGVQPTMPKDAPRLSQDLQNLILCWINNGAKEK